jgi:hypothetical protein
VAADFETSGQVYSFKEKGNAPNWSAALSKIFPPLGTSQIIQSREWNKLRRNCVY